MKRMLKNFVLVLAASTPVVLASVPGSFKGRAISNDTMIYQNLHEVRLTPVKYSELDAKIDSDLEKLSATEKQHRTRVLPLRISAPMDRVMNTHYKSGFKSDKKGRRH